MNIKLIVTGSRPWELWARHWGVSYLIGEKILFDTFGNFPALFRKAKRANVDLKNIESVVLSHEHWDHIGGLWQLLKLKKELNIYLPPHANKKIKDRIRAAGGNVFDAPGIKPLSSLISVSDEIMGSNKGKPIPEQAIVIKSAKGIILVCGCSHPGIIPTVRKTRELFNAPVHGIIGGLHLMNSPSNAINRCAEDLLNEGVELIAPTHCTGWRAERIFKKVFREKYIRLDEGQTLSV